jgi:hypothetical protein
MAFILRKKNNLTTGAQAARLPDCEAIEKSIDGFQV